MILGGSGTITMWQGKAGNGVQPILLSVRSLYVPYFFPVVLILMQTVRTPKKTTRIDLYTRTDLQPLAVTIRFGPIVSASALSLNLLTER